MKDKQYNNYLKNINEFILSEDSIPFRSDYLAKVIAGEILNKCDFDGNCRTNRWVGKPNVSVCTGCSFEKEFH